MKEEITLHVYYNRQEALNALNCLMEYFPKAKYSLSSMHVRLGNQVCMFCPQQDIEDHKIDGLSLIAFVLHDRVKQTLDSKSCAYIRSRINVGS